MMNQEVLGIIAGSLSTFAFLPQVIKTIRTNEVRDLSLLTLAAQTVGTFLWLIYGIILKSVSLIGANALTCIFVFTILVLKIKWMRQQIKNKKQISFF